MQNLNEIRHHLHAVKQTRQITNAMYLLSTSRMKKAITRMEYNHEYYRRVRATMKDIIKKSSSVKSKYMEHKEGNRAAFLVIAGDKGLCGSYNSNVLNYAWNLMHDYSEAHVATIGIMATEYFMKKGVIPDIEIIGVSQDPSLFNARNITNDLFKMFEDDILDEVYIVSTSFVNSAVQYPRSVRLLPLDLGDFSDVDYEYEKDADTIYQPSAESVFQTLVPQYAIGLVFNSLVEAFASEHCARMNAMQNSTRNAEEMIDRLQGQYNSARQLAITQEISEISAATQALKGGKY